METVTYGILADKKDLRTLDPYNPPDNIHFLHSVDVYSDKRHRLRRYLLLHNMARSRSQQAGRMELKKDYQ